MLVLIDHFECRRTTYFTDLKMLEYYQKIYSWNSKSTKTKNNVTYYTRYTMLKKSFLMVYVGTYDCYENIKIKHWFLEELFRILGKWFQPIQLYLRASFSSPTQTSFFLIWAGDSMGTSNGPYVMLRPSYIGYTYIDILSLIGMKYYCSNSIFSLLKLPISSVSLINWLTLFKAFAELFLRRY